MQLTLASIGRFFLVPGERAIGARGPEFIELHYMITGAVSVDRSCARRHMRMATTTIEHD